MPNNDHPISSNNKTPHFTRDIFYGQSDTTLVQLIPTSGIVHFVPGTDGKHPAGSTRISPLEAANGISRASARLPADQIGERRYRPAHNGNRAAFGIRNRPEYAPTHTGLSGSNGQQTPHRRQVVSLMQFDTTKIGEPRPDVSRPGTGSKTYTSGQTNGRGDTPPDPDNHSRCFTHAERPRRGVRQDKGVLTNALAASRQPAPHEKDGRAHFANKDSPRSQNVPRSQSHSIGRALVHSTIWQNPAVHAELKRIAEEEGLSFSQVGATACEQWVRQRLHDRHEALLYPVLRQLIRDELKAFGNRIVFFLIRIAFAAEQSRILITNVLHKICMQMGLPSDKFDALVDKSNKMARRNIIAHSPEIKTLMQEWEFSHDDDKKDTNGKEKK